jgi:MTH538 TIR-like domain (DUF1863)
LMCAWDAHEDIAFNFADVQLDEAINSDNPSYIKSICRDQIRRASTFVLLIGTDTWTKADFVKYEVEVAIEKGCNLIGVNLNNCRVKDCLCPHFLENKGAVFIPFSSRIAAKALTLSARSEGDWFFKDDVYTKLGYKLEGDTAVLPPPSNPFRSGKPSWAK